MTQPYAIRMENVGKRYRIGRRLRYRMLRDSVREAAVSFWQTLAGNRDQNTDVIWALDDVTLRVPAGQSLGIIGSNGAGKTTLLKILSRVTAPTRGRARVRGRVGSLLEVGTGFHPELTGRENIYLNGAILGMRKAEIDRKFDEIVAFSEIEQFLDTPAKFFSSGMRMRLAFAVAVHLEPEILLVDEILAVGDQSFQTKSLAKMSEVVRGGRTILFVSHNMAAVRALCQEAIYLDKGRIRHRGAVQETIDHYLSSGGDQISAKFHVAPDAASPLQFLDAFVTDEAGHAASRLPHDRPFFINIRLAVRAPQFNVRPGLSILDSQLDTVLSSYDLELSRQTAFHLTPGVYAYTVEVPAPLLVPGKYRLSLAFFRTFARSARAFARVEHVCPFEIFDSGSQLAKAFIHWTGRVAPSLTWECAEVVAASNID